MTLLHRTHVSLDSAAKMVAKAMGRDREARSIRIFRNNLMSGKARREAITHYEFVLAQADATGRPDKEKAELALQFLREHAAPAT